MGYIKVEVTQDDIDRAIKNHSSKCVVAQAVARTLPQAHRISVDIQTVRFTDSRGTRRVYLTPPAVERYIVAFDAGDTIAPFTFRLDDAWRVNVRSEAKTPDGKKRNAAADRVRRAAKKKAAAEANQDATPTERQLAAEKLAAAETERKLIAAQHPSPSQLPLSERAPAQEEGIKPSPRERGIPKGAGAGGVNTNSRHYGQRAMRINQARFAAQQEPEA